MRRLLPILLLWPLLCGPWALHAQPTAPKLLPDRDVDIVYRVTKAGEKERERVRWHLPAAIERIDSPSGTSTIIDHHTHDVVLLLNATRSVLRLENARPNVLDLDAHQNFAPAGSARVAGLDCTIWRWTDGGDGTAHTACITADGVLLRRQENGLTVVEARSVTYRKQDPALFVAPSGYEPSLSPEGDPQ